MNIRFPKITRRRFLLLTALASPGLIAADANWLEPDWVKVRSVKLTEGKPSHRIVHITDIHHKGDRPYLESVVRKINAPFPDAVCFTGDLIEEKKFVPEALHILEGIQSPLYGIPGNHDYWSHAVFDEFRESFARTGGAWLMDAPDAHSRTGKSSSAGRLACTAGPRRSSRRAGVKNILLLHYPLAQRTCVRPI